ncbi:MAG: cysteine hydrolase [Phycisphaerae bacterium]|nr:cysteine hydrolase [Phycisphaerae bacterium]
MNELMHRKQERIDELHACLPGRTALIVVDMQRGFLDPGASLEMPAGREIVPRVRQLVDACRRGAVPVIFTEYVYATAVPCLRGDPFGPEHLPPANGNVGGFGAPSGNCLVHAGGGRPASAVVGAGPESAQVIDELAPRSDELVVRGHTYDKFIGTPLDLALRSQDIRCLVFAGVATDICVACTLMTAANLDYRCTAVTDACATVDDDLQAAAIEIWKRKFARLRTTAQMIEEIQTLAAASTAEVAT